MKFDIVDRKRIFFSRIIYYLTFFIHFFMILATGGRATNSGGLIEWAGYGPNSYLYIVAGITYLLSIFILLYSYDWKNSSYTSGKINFHEEKIIIAHKKQTPLNLMNH